MKKFLVILGITALVWLGVSMSEPVDYQLSMKVEFTGFDTVRYAILHADTSIDLTVESDGFNAFLNSLNSRDAVLRIGIEDDTSTQAVGADRLQTAVVDKLHGIKKIQNITDSLYITLAERQHKNFVPSLDNVEFSFAEQYGLYGRPKVTPEVVTLYGPAEALSRIERLPVAAATVKGVSRSGHYRLQLEPIWEQYGDVHPSCTTIDIFVPVEAYVEKEYKVPITVAGADTSVQLRLYPSDATLRVWVAQCDLQKVPDFNVSIDYGDIEHHRQHIVPRLTQFPSYMRPRSLKPDEVQCVIIK